MSGARNLDVAGTVVDSRDMALLKRLGTFVAVGALLGAVIASLVTPTILVAENTTRAGNAQCPCAEVTRDTATQLIRAQLLGAAIGAGALLLLGIVLSIRGRAKHKTLTASTADVRPTVAASSSAPASSSGSSSGDSGGGGLPPATT